MTNRVRCAECGLINWATSANCKRCGVPLATPPFNRVPGADAYEAPPPDEPHATVSDTQAGRYQPQTNPHYAHTAPGGYGAFPYPHTAPGGYGPPPPGGAYTPYHAYAPPLPPNTGLATASLILGIISVPGLLMCGLGALTGLVGLIIGVVALRKAKQKPQEYGGKSSALAGIVTSAFGVAVGGLLIPAIAIPNLLSSRRAANEAAAIPAMRLIHSAELTYQSTEGNGQFGTLTELRAAGLIDDQIAGGLKSGYRFQVRVVPGAKYSPARYECVAAPNITKGINSSGRRSFYINETGIVRASSVPGVKASNTDSPLNLDR